MNILITGCAGFIGSHVVEEFLKCGNYRIFGFDKLTYAGNLNNLSKSKKDQNFKFIKGDICDHKHMSQICKDNKIKWIINLAAETHVDNSIISCKNFIKTNIEGTSVILKICKDQNINLLHFSTDEVYGTKLKGVFKESDILNPKNPYSATKAAADHLIKSFENTYNINSVIVRPSNNYGPRQHKEKLLPKIIDCIRKNKKIPIYGNGKQTREWTYVKDTAKAVKFILENATFGEIYNITSSYELENIELVKIVTEKLNVNYKNNVVFIKDRLGHDKRYAISNKKLKKLGYSSYTSITLGLNNTL